MADPFIGEIRIFGGNFAPKHWAFCSGGFLTINGNSALYSLLGTTFGGDGRVNFQLPDLRGRIPIGQGQGPGLSNRIIGQAFGLERVTLTESQTGHNHNFMGSTKNATTDNPSGMVLGTVTDGKYYEEVGGDPEVIEPLMDDSVVKTGSGYPHNNMMPSMCVQFIISLAGIYPERP